MTPTPNLTFGQAFDRVLAEPGKMYMRCRGSNKAFGIEHGNIAMWTYIGVHDGLPVTWDVPSICDALDSDVMLHKGPWECGSLDAVLASAMNEKV